MVRCCQNHSIWKPGRMGSCQVPGLMETVMCPGFRGVDSVDFMPRLGLREAFHTRSG